MPQSKIRISDNIYEPFSIFRVKRVKGGNSLLQETEIQQNGTVQPPTSEAADAKAAQAAQAATDLANQPKRLHVSNIPFRFRDPDLRAMFGVSWTLRGYAPG